MKNKWTFEQLKYLASVCSSRSELQRTNMKAYKVAAKRGILDEIFSHLPKINQFKDKNHRFKWSDKKLEEEALKYNSRIDFFEKSGSAYSIAANRNMLDRICSHMKDGSNVSRQELSLLLELIDKYPTAKKAHFRKIEIKDKPHIRGFDIDIYVQELRKGIEFDGRYFHSLAGLKRSRPNWPEEDLKNYHEIKDNYFKSIDICILHIKEKDWLKNKQKCLMAALNFLGKNA